MTNSQLPYIGRCSFCGTGLLRFARCRSCQDLVAICDECELIWRDIALWKADPQLTSDGAHPHCPVCSQQRGQWHFLTRQEVESEGLLRYCEGESL